MNSFNQYTFRVGELEVHSKEVSQYISGQPDNLPEEFELAMVEIISNFEDNHILTGHSLYEAEINKTQLRIGQTFFEVGNHVSTMLSGVEKVAVFACTLQPKLNERLRNISDPGRSFLCDIVATIWIEKALKKQSDLLHSNYQLHCTNTICPGNCDWDINDQSKLLTLLPDHFLGISINEYGMMHPVKSISGIIGLGETVRYEETGCLKCNSKNCLYRKKESHTKENRNFFKQNNSINAI